jgi:lactate racemase
VVELALPYGRAPYPVRLGGDVVVVEARGPSGCAAPVSEILEGALDAPIGSLPIERRVSPGDRVTVVISDASRAEPRAAMLTALRARLPPRVRVTIAVATGTHGPCAVERLGLTDLGDELIVHDGYRDADLVLVGTTRRGTPVRLHRCAVDGLVVATGAIRPHYFAGFGAGIKAIFPGLGGAREVRINHDLKREARARAGVVEGNPCRDDLEEVAAMLPRSPFLLNVVMDPEATVRAAVTGDVIAAFRAGAALARPWFTAHAPRARWVIVSDHLPVTASLYQASKLVAAVAPIVEDGGTIVVAAECPEGIGPVEVVNRAIYEIGLRPRLPERHRVVLVSGLPRQAVEPSYAAWAPTVEAAVAGAAGPIVVAPCASQVILA